MGNGQWAVGKFEKQSCYKIADPRDKIPRGSAILNNLSFTYCLLPTAYNHMASGIFFSSFNFFNEGSI
jgi:hypothetical protein